MNLLSKWTYALSSMQISVLIYTFLSYFYSNLDITAFKIMYNSYFSTHLLY